MWLHQDFSVPGKKLGPFGFDLEMMDWVAPYGKGVFSDFIIQGIRDNPADTAFQPKGRLRLSFSNKKDGIMPIRKELIGGSALRSPAQAPEEGYLAEWEFPNLVDPANPESVDLPERVYVFRVRTKLDEKGNIIESRYGKIYGNMSSLLSDNLPSFWTTYYLSSKPNDRNLEWDMEKNLFRDLPQSQWPDQP